MYDVEPCLQIRSDSIIAYNNYPRRSLIRSIAQRESIAKLHISIRGLLKNRPVPGVIDRLFFDIEKKITYRDTGVEWEIYKVTYTGKLCIGAKKRLTKAIEHLVMLTEKERKVYNPKSGNAFKFRLSFLTLTISQSKFVNGKTAHKLLLEPFLRWMRETHGCKLYIWKAELQQRGQLHYHITSDAFIHYQSVRTKWNELQKEAGFLNEHFERYGNYSPPSTQIKSVRKIKNMGHYLVKEIAKSFQNDASIEGKVWDCCKILKGEAFFTINADSGTMAEINKCIEANEVRYVVKDFCTIYQFIDKKPFHILQKGDQLAYQRHLWEIIHLPDKEIEPELIVETKEKQKFIIRYDLFSDN